MKAESGDMETPREIAERLVATALELTPAAFEQVFNDTLAKTTDADVQSRLMWVAGMYLDRHPGAFQLPRSLAERQLAAANFDHLLAGLKAIRHCGASISEVIASYLAAMKRADWEDRRAGLSQLSQFLDDLPRTSKYKMADCDELNSILRQIASTAPHEFDRELATRCIARLQNAKSP